ncbi:MAG: acyltransferase family protein, partial [Cyanobacteria bacterium P01_C01_bin.72]
QNTNNLKNTLLNLINNQNLYELIINGADFSFKVYGIYFLVYLVILSWLYYILRQQMRTYAQVNRWIIIFGIINLLLPFLPPSYKLVRESLLAFLIYLPLAKMLYFDYQKKSSWQPKIVKFGLIYVATAILEATAIAISSQLPLITYRYSPYGRLSVVFLAVCLIYASFYVTQDWAKIKFLKLVSSCSLGIYLIHGFVIDYLNTFELSLSPAFSFVLILSISLIISFVIRNIPYAKQILIL